MVKIKVQSLKDHSVKSVLPSTSGHLPNMGSAKTQLRPEVHQESQKHLTILKWKAAPCPEPGIQL